MVPKVPVVPKPILICFFRDFKYFTLPVVNYTSPLLNLVPKVPVVPKPILICFLRDLKYITFPVVNYTSLFLKCCTKDTSGTETHSHMLLKRFQVYYFSSSELYITVHKMWYKRCQWYRNPFSYASLEISSILLFQL